MTKEINHPLLRLEALKIARDTVVGGTPTELVTAASAFEDFLLGREAPGPDAATAAELVTILQDIDRLARAGHPLPILRIARGIEIATKIMEDAEATE